MRQPKGFKHTKRNFKTWFTDKELVAILDAGITLCGVTPDKQVVIVYQNQQHTMARQSVVQLTT